MKISDLSRAAGVPLATIKFYLREGLLPPGKPLSRTSASYEQGHVDRLKLLRALREVGDVPISRLREVTTVLDRGDPAMMPVLSAGVDALNSDREPPGTDETSHGRATADAIIAKAGWTNVRPEAPDRRRLGALLEVVAAFGTHEGRMDVLWAYVEAADRIGRGDVENLDASQSPSGILSEVVVGQVIFGELLLALRRLAEEHYAFERFG